MQPQPTPTAPQERLADEDITAAVDRFLATRKGLSASLIDVTTRDGIVELTGFVGTLLERALAEAIAKEVRGVRGVLNELVIRTADVPDAPLLGDVEAALARDPATAAYNVRCHVHAGQVTVEGTLQSWAEQQLVLLAVQGVRGVRAIHLKLNLRDDEVSNTDADLITQIRAVLDWDIRVQSELVSIRAHEGVVHLEGTVGTAAERDFAVTTAYQAGARRVDARDLFVARWALDPALRPQKFAAAPDEDVAEAVRDALRLDPRVRAFAPTVHVRDGVVTLAGTVGNLLAQRTAEQDAENVVGVREVHNLLQVETHYPAPDAATRQHIKAALACDPYVGHYTFTLNVSHSKVQLYGTVDAQADAERAADVAAGVTGVVSLDNHVQTSATAQDFAPPAADGNIEPDHVLEQRLRNHFYWSALLHDENIEVEVRHGRVTLTGTVNTHLERRTAAREAYACGARDVNNHLHLPAYAR
ncbi:BON domain-containing protein [Hymenobacter sp. CRA2]|uniref:BON domain-containing protein n=1 Tax=Hymenobacter sp. CRA2 TaxID=1955620 RepID=UPI0009900B6B|nr:BON domain-containing protein [Hymenobacter sp. CRA2]OON69942.1 hypothetical protein B0919_04115 [Hymenobacter sp. CRA2]